MGRYLKSKLSSKFEAQYAIVSPVIVLLQQSNVPEDYASIQGYLSKQYTEGTPNNKAICLKLKTIGVTSALTIASYMSRFYSLYKKI